jgi:hypothetical protein
MSTLSCYHIRTSHSLSALRAIAPRVVTDFRIKNHVFSISPLFILIQPANLSLSLLPHPHLHRYPNSHLHSFNIAHLIPDFMRFRSSSVIRSQIPKTSDSHPANLIHCLHHLLLLISILAFSTASAFCLIHPIFSAYCFWRQNSPDVSTAPDAIPTLR